MQKESDVLQYNWTNKTILVVEDEEINYYYLKDVLRDTKATIIHAHNGLEAVDFCKNNENIDLVLMDIKLPIMDGYKATRAIKEFRPTLPIIAQTAYSLSGEKNLSIEAGCSEYLTKPIKPDVLLNSLAKYLKK
jgi:two-component system, cell cycle response regulator DivK